MTKILRKTLLMCCLAISNAVFAEPTTGNLTIVNIRPYNQAGGPGAVYLTVDQVSLCGTNIYMIPLEWNGAKESVAVAMTALATGRTVQIEIDNAGCATPAWRTPVQSIYLFK